MVQYIAKPYGPSSFTDINDCASYWKLNDCTTISDANIEMELRDRSIPFTAGSTRARRVELLSRAERGFVSYETCSSEELKAFCIQRGVLNSDGTKVRVVKTQLSIQNAVRRGFRAASFPPPEQVHEHDLVGLLESADDNAAFHHFLDLPAKLRKRIFSLHVSGLDYYHVPSQPPITKVSRLVRDESLPLFYALCPFNIRIARRPPTITSISKPAAMYSEAVERYIATSNESDIERLRIILSVEPEPWKFTSWEYILAVDGNHGVCMDRVEAAHHEKKREYMLQQTREQLNEKMEELCDHLRERDEGLKLEQSDWELLKDVFG